MVDIRIVFMGTPEFAVASLQALVENNWPVVAVVTAPDRRQGRGQVLTPSPVKAYAVAHKIPVLQPPNLKAPAFLSQLAAFKANLQVVVAFRMLPEAVWRLPELGTFNLHASLLPDYRGAAPINWAIINGEKETGVTTFFLQHEIDTGEIILQEKEPIREDDTVGALYHRLMAKGSKLVLKTVEQIAADKVTTTPQKPVTQPKTAPKLYKETCEIDWNKPFSQVFNLVRGLNPYPAAWTTLAKQHCKIFWLKKAALTRAAAPGTMVTDHRQQLWVKCADTWAEITELQLAGKRKMTAAELLRGNPLAHLPGIEDNI